MKRKLAFSLMSILMMGLLSSMPAAYADTITLTLLNPTVHTGLGSTTTFDAIVTAPSTNLGTVYLNGDSFTIDSPATIDDTGFWNNFFSIDPGATLTNLLFTVTIPSTAPYGEYTGTFNLLGGPINGVSDDVLASATFDVIATPEPSTFLLLGTGLSGLAAALNRRRTI